MKYYRVQIAECGFSPTHRWRSVNCYVVFVDSRIKGVGKFVEVLGAVDGKSEVKDRGAVVYSLSRDVCIR